MKDMLGREAVITAATALDLFLRTIGDCRTVTRRVGLEEALGMVLSVDIASSADLPAFDRSTVDGYAVRASDTFGAAETMPAYLNLSGEVFMGLPASSPVAPASACRIPTGGMLPEGADAVVMFEHVQVIDDKLLEVLKPAAPFENVIRAGDDLRSGEAVLRRGRCLRPADLGAAAAMGISELEVYGKPRVSIISTGDEIIPVGQTPAAGQIRDSNSYVIGGMVSEAGGIPLRKGIFSDDYDAIRQVIEESLTDSELIAVSGGTSVGVRDMIARVITDIGNPGILFHGLSLKPGKPMIGGVMKGIPILGLPGHPAAVSVCLDIFLRPLLNSLRGLQERHADRMKGVLRARLARNVSSSQGREEHIRVVIEERQDGLWAVPLLGKSGLIRTLVHADGTFIIPVNLNGMEQGDVIDVNLL